MRSSGPKENDQWLRKGCALVCFDNQGVSCETFRCCADVAGVDEQYGRLKTHKLRIDIVLTN